MIKIKEIYGFALVYDEYLKRFVIRDTDGTELAYGETQDEAEAKAKILNKQEFKCIRIIKVGDEGRVGRGELTSLNKDDKSFWVSMEKSDSWGSGRQKVSLSHMRGYYEATETNLKIIEDIIVKREAADTILAEILSLKETLELPINLDYFGIKQPF